MTQGIALLPDDVVHLIAAGEVIDSLAAAVRELAENAIDAGATRIAITIWVEQWRIRVADNGLGMSLDDLQRAAIAHSTSKIRDRQDLWKISSLGFRGEALHSLAQLSRLEIASHPRLPDLTGFSTRQPTGHETTHPSGGWAASYNHQGDLIQLEPVAIAPGTIVTADNIFANLPGRRQAFPNPAQQLRAIQAIIHQLALCHPHVTWQVQQSNRDWFTIFPGETARQILPQILRDVQVEDLQEVVWQQDREDKGAGSDKKVWSTSSQSPSLSLLLGLPDRCHRRRPDWVRVAVNGRFVQVPELEQAMLAELRRTLPRDRFPVCLVHLRVPPEQIDWNRHPAKSEIYLHQLEEWRQRVAAAIAKALQLNPNSLPESLHSSRISTLLKTAETAGVYNLSASPPQLAGSSPLPHSRPPVPTPLKALAQVHNTYILAEHPTGIWLIEQHIAHERVLYEQLSDRWQMVDLEPPVILGRLTTAQQDQLQRLGIEVEPFGEQTWVARSAPELLAKRQDCAEALIELSLGGDIQTAQAAIACRSAIRNGMPLSLEAMQTLLNQWQQTRNPRTCPHGRPICLTLEETSLSRFFRRHWMIGKSHGI